MRHVPTACPGVCALQKSAEEAGGRLKGGGVLYFESLGGVTITNCDFAHNSALYGNGGSLFCSTCGDLVVTSSRFTNNSAAGSVSNRLLNPQEVYHAKQAPCMKLWSMPPALATCWLSGGGTIACVLPREASALCACLLTAVHLA
jgi:hypothetical protein